MPQPAAQFPESLLWSNPWFHHVILIEKVKDLDIRVWYMAQTLANGWSRNVLQLMMKSEAHAPYGQKTEPTSKLFDNQQIAAEINCNFSRELMTNSTDGTQDRPCFTVGA